MCYHDDVDVKLKNKLLGQKKNPFYNISLIAVVTLRLIN